ncbi:MAG: alpha/beta fold hydrolase [Desulfitobacteriaceae bacterium]
MPLVLLHGLGASCTAWQPNFFFLADHFRVLAPDLPGAGLSDKPVTEYTLEFYVNFLREFLDYLKIDQCVILGNSLGGEIAAAFAHRFPGKVWGLILEDSAGLGRDVAAELKPTVLNSVDKAGIRKLLELLFHDSQFIYPGTIEEMFNLRQQAGAFEALESAVENLLTEDGQKVDISEQLPELSLPTLVIWGEQDRITPQSHGLKAVQQLPNGQLSVYENCGHCPHIEAAERFNQEVKSFVEKLML